MRLSIRRSQLVCSYKATFGSKSPAGPRILFATALQLASEAAKAVELFKASAEAAKGRARALVDLRTQAPSVAVLQAPLIVAPAEVLLLRSAIAEMVVVDLLLLLAPLVALLAPLVVLLAPAVVLVLLPVRVLARLAPLVVLLLAVSAI